MERAEILLKGLETQRALYEKLLEIMKSELEALCSEKNKNSLLTLLKEKLSIMEKVQLEDTRIGDIKKEWKDLVGEDSPERVKIETTLKHMEGLLKEILDLEEKTHEFFESFKADLDDAKSKSNALRATRAYNDKQFN